MAFYLQHYFDPDFDFRSLRPSETSDGQADRYNLGYAQNVSKGQILAEIVPLERVVEPLPRFTLEDAVFPAGANTQVAADHPEYLVSTVNGYVFYHEQHIVVKPLLNIYKDVDFHTGNIFFVGDAVFHQDIKAGFKVQANNILIKGMVEGGEARANKDLKVEGGARGGIGDRCLIDSGGGLRIGFAEKVELRARNALIIDRFAAHTTIYSAGETIINELLVGGTCHVAKYMVVKGVLGNKAQVATKISLGYDPFVTRELAQCDKRLAKLNERITQYLSIAGNRSLENTELGAKLESAQKKRQMLLKLRESFKKILNENEQHLRHCRFVALGTIHPGVEVCIGRVCHTVTEPIVDGAYFRLRGDEILVSSVPPKVHQFFNK